MTRALAEAVGFKPTTYNGVKGHCLESLGDASI